MGLESNVDIIHVVIFFDHPDSIPTFKLAKDIFDKFNDSFDADPQIIQLPLDAPREIPRCIINSNDKSTVLTITLDRLDFVCPIRSGQDWNGRLRNLLASFCNILTVHGVGIIRIGSTVESFASDDINTQIAKYVNFDNFISSVEKTLFWVDKVTIDDSIYNICRTVLVNPTLQPHGNRILIDINTDPTYKIVQDKIQDHIETILNSLKEKLKNVFE